MWNPIEIPASWGSTVVIFVALYRNPCLPTRTSWNGMFMMIFCAQSERNSFSFHFLKIWHTPEVSVFFFSSHLGHSTYTQYPLEYSVSHESIHMYINVLCIFVLFVSRPCVRYQRITPSDNRGILHLRRSSWPRVSSSWKDRWAMRIKGPWLVRVYRGIYMEYTTQLYGIINQYMDPWSLLNNQDSMEIWK